MEVCPEKEPLKRQIAIFREVDPDIAARLEKATGIKGYPGIADMHFNGTHNAMKKGKTDFANHLTAHTAGVNEANVNGGPILGSHAGAVKAH
jgi:catalase